MNKRQRIRMWRKYILKYAKICEETKRPPEKWYRPYRKGSYYLAIVQENGLSASIGHKNKYLAYKEAYYILKNYLHEVGGNDNADTKVY